MTKRSKTTLFALLALIAAFGLILTGCPDAAGSSSTTTEYVNVPADVVKVVDVQFSNGKTDATAKLTFDVVLPSGTWDEAALDDPAFNSAAIAALFRFDIPTGSLLNLSSGYTFLPSLDETKTKLTVTATKDAGDGVTSETRVGVELIAPRAIKALITGRQALPISTEVETWRYTDGALVSIESVVMTDAKIATDKGKAVITLKLNGDHKWASDFDRTKALTLFEGIDGAESGGGTDLAAYSGGGVLQGAGTGTAILTLEAGAAVTAYGTVTAVLDLATAVPLAYVTGATATSAPLIDLDNASYQTKTVEITTTSNGVAGTNSITGLLANAKYLILETDRAGTKKWYVSATNGVMALIDGLTSAGALTSAVFGGSYTALYGLDNDKIYDVYVYTSSSGGNVTLTASNKNRALNLSSNHAIVVGNNMGAGSLIVVLDSAITDDTTTVSGVAPVEDSLIDVTTHTWKFEANSSYTVTGIVVTFAETEHFFKITGFGASTAFKITRADP